jgi:hypothetical protein
MPDGFIRLCTEVSREGIIVRAHPHGIIVRAHPHYRRTGEWYDWGGGVDDGVIPAHVRLFVDLPVVDHPIMLANCVVDAPGVYAVVELLVDESLSLLSLVNVSAFDGPCIAVPDPQTDEDVAGDSTLNYLILRSRDDWRKQFKDDTLAYKRAEDDTTSDEDNADHAGAT